MGLHEHFGQLETRIRRALDYDDSTAPANGQAILWVPDGGGGGKFTPRTITPSGIGAAAAAHAHTAGDITSGTMAAARLPIGTASGTVAAGNDSRIVGAEQTTSKDQPGGYPGLDSNGRLDSTDMPLVPTPVRSGSVSTSLTIDASTGAGNVIDLTVSGNATINISAPSNHQRLVLHLLASGAARTVTFGSAILEPPGVPSAYLIPQNTVLTVELEYVGNRPTPMWLLVRTRNGDQADTTGAVLAAARSTANQTLPSTASTWTQVNLAGEDVDDDNVHSTSSNTGRFTYSRAGIYKISAMIAWTSGQSTTSPNRQMRLNRSGSVVNNSVVNGIYVSAGLNMVLPAMLVTVAAGDYLQLEAASGLASAVLAGSAADYGSFMTSELVRAL